MNNCIEHLKLTRPGLVLENLPETTTACVEIETALTVLDKETNTLIEKMNARRARQELGVNCAVLEAAEWHQWQATALRRFHEVREETAGRLLLLCDEKLHAEAAEIADREKGIARGLSGLLHDEGAGADLALMLKRVTGGLPTDGNLITARNGWHRLCRESARALIELPGAPIPTPTNSDNANELQKLLENKKENSI